MTDTMLGKVVEMPGYDDAVVAFEEAPPNAWHCVVLDGRSQGSQITVKDDFLRSCKPVPLMRGETLQKILDALDKLNEKAGGDVYITIGNDRRLAYADAASLIREALS